MQLSEQYRDNEKLLLHLKGNTKQYNARHSVQIPVEEYQKTVVLPSHSIICTHSTKTTPYILHNGLSHHHDLVLWEVPCSRNRCVHLILASHPLNTYDRSELRGC